MGEIKFNKVIYEREGDKYVVMGFNNDIAEEGIILANNIIDANVGRTIADTIARQHHCKSFRSFGWNLCNR